jgi:hypothetical protein
LHSRLHASAEYAFLLNAKDHVDIRLVSSLTDDDEDRFAIVLMKAMRELHANFPAAYSVRIETAGGKVFQQRWNATDFAFSGETPAGPRKRDKTRS